MDTIASQCQGLLSVLVCHDHHWIQLSKLAVAVRPWLAMDISGVLPHLMIRPQHRCTTGKALHDMAFAAEYARDDEMHRAG